MNIQEPQDHEGTGIAIGDKVILPTGKIIRVRYLAYKMRQDEVPGWYTQDGFKVENTRKVFGDSKDDVMADCMLPPYLYGKKYPELYNSPSHLWQSVHKHICERTESIVRGEYENVD